MSYLNRVLLYELEDIVGEDNVTDKQADLEAVSTDVCSISRFWIDRGVAVQGTPAVRCPSSAGSSWTSARWPGC